MAWWPTTAACAHSRTTNLTFEQHSTHPQQHSTHPHCLDQDRITNKLTKTYQTKQQLARALGWGGQQQAMRGRRRAGWRGDRRRTRGGGNDRCRAGWWRRPRCGGPGGMGAGGEESVKNAKKKMALVYIGHTPLLPVLSPHRE